MTRKNQPKFRPSLTVGDMLDIANALSKFNPHSPALTVVQQFVVKLAVTNPELFPRGVGSNLNSIGHSGNMDALNAAIATAEQVISINTGSANTPSNQYFAQDNNASELSEANQSIGFPDSELPAGLLSLKEETYIHIMQSGAVSASATEYAIKVAIDTHIMKNSEANSAKLAIPIEALSLMCPLANKPEIEL